MLNDGYRTVLDQVQRLSSEEQFQLLEDLVVMLRQRTTNKPQHSTLDLAELGKEVWQGVDVGEYIKRERDAWDTGKP